MRRLILGVTVTVSTIAAAFAGNPQGQESASVCLDPAYLEAGARFVLSYQYRNNGSVIRTTQEQIDVQGPMTFNGHDTIAVNTHVRTLTGEGLGKAANTLSYVQTRNGEVLTLGSVTTEGVSSSSGALETAFDPPVVFSYTLVPGESITTVTTGTQTTPWFPINPSTTTFAETVTYTFLGFDDVTVPAGTFSGVCKWGIWRLRDKVTSGTTEWKTRKGALVKTLTGSEIGELLSGTVNGAPVGS